MDEEYADYEEFDEDIYYPCYACGELIHQDDDVCPECGYNNESEPFVPKSQTV